MNFPLLGAIKGAHLTPEVGCFFKIVKRQLFYCFIIQLVKKLQSWSVYEVIEDILPFVLNTKRPVSDIWLLRYKQNSLGCFQKNSEFPFFMGHPVVPRNYLASQKVSVALRHNQVKQQNVFEIAA